MRNIAYQRRVGESGVGTVRCVGRLIERLVAPWVPLVIGDCDGDGGADHMRCLLLQRPRLQRDSPRPL